MKASKQVKETMKKYGTFNLVEKADECNCPHDFGHRTSCNLVKKSSLSQLQIKTFEDLLESYNMRSETGKIRFLSMKFIPVPKEDNCKECHFIVYKGEEGDMCKSCKSSGKQDKYIQTQDIPFEELKDSNKLWISKGDHLKAVDEAYAVGLSECYAVFNDELNKQEKLIKQLKNISKGGKK